jgi:protein-S-isoprenylcysteine O-methyltransferase Ste14
MAAAASPVPTVPSVHPTEANKLIRWAFFSLLAAVIPMAIAGEVGSVYLWALAAGCSAVAFYAVHTISPELARERYHPPSPGLDGATLRWVRPIIFATVVFALLDSGRWHVSAPMPAGWRIVGLIAFFTGLAMFVYPMSVNRFFSSVVRIQAERGHHVIDSGPYARVRHPGYVGMLLFGATMPLALGSWWAFLPAIAIVGFGFRRVWVEDRFLVANLPGYREYTARVRYRLLPGIW